MKKDRDEIYGTDFGLVQNWFTERGFKVLPRKHTCANGPDLIAINGSDAIRVEIKKLVYACRAWRAKPVSKSRQRDDYVCVIFPCGYLFVESMEDYLKACPPSGFRYFTAFPDNQTARRLKDGK